MVNHYKDWQPSYKFAISSSAIDSVDTVLKNNSAKKDYVFMSQNHLKAQREGKQPPIQMKQLLNKNYILDQARQAEQKHWSSSVTIPDGSENDTVVIQDESNQ